MFFGSCVAADLIDVTEVGWTSRWLFVNCLQHVHLTLTTRINENSLICARHFNLLKLGNEIKYVSIYYNETVLTTTDILVTPVISVCVLLSTAKSILSLPGVFNKSSFL